VVDEIVDREGLALRAAWEIEAAATAILERARDVSAEDLVYRSLAIRIKQLASLQMRCYDKADDCADGECALYGIAAGAAV
jgi:hypothetical protein